MITSTIEHLSRILRVDKNTLENIDEKMSSRSQKTGILESIERENQTKIDKVIKELKIKNGEAVHIYNALIDKIQLDDKALYEMLGNPRCEEEGGCSVLADAAIDLAKVPNGFFLKWDRARELLLKNPPGNIIKYLGYEDIDELLKKEDIKNIFSALRFSEDPEWLNNVFFKGYEELTANDFEERPIEILALGNKWLRLSKYFRKRKHHNVSHLKELGVIFILPERMDIHGETLRLFSLLLHYLHEITFYSDIFKTAAKSNGKKFDDRNFPQLFISGLKGDVLDERLPNKEATNWMIVQRYLAKDDANDWRLFEPHVNPEAGHWVKAEEDISNINKIFPSIDLSFWYELDYVGDFFPSEAGDALVSFNLIDTVMSLVQRKEMIKYLYHHQEALWNKIFESYIGQKKMQELIMDNFFKGYITL